MVTGVVDITLAPVTRWLKHCGWPSALEWLSSSERLRLERITHAARRAQFIAGRFALRALLAAHFPQTQWSDWELAAPIDQPPCISACANSDCADIEALHLSLTHSANLLAVALAYQPIGIDLEVSNKPRALSDLIFTICTADEREQLRHLPYHLQRRMFDAMWTLKEAWFKRETTGIDLSKIARLQTAQFASDAGEHNGWIAQAEGYTLAVCANTLNNHEVRCRVLDVPGTPVVTRYHVGLLLTD